jgi:hypothetical protein
LDEGVVGWRIVLEELRSRSSNIEADHNDGHPQTTARTAALRPDLLDGC